MSEKFSTAHPYLVERSNGNIDVMQPTGRRVERHGVDERGNAVVTHMYELQGQTIGEDRKGNVGYPTKFVHEDNLSLDAQERLAETLHESLDTTTLRRIGASATHGLVEMPNSPTPQETANNATEVQAPEANEYDRLFDVSDDDTDRSVEGAAVRPEKSLEEIRRQEDMNVWSGNIRDYENGKQ